MRESARPVRGFSEDHDLAPPRAKLTARAAWWAISHIGRDNAPVQSVARRLGVDWHTVWDTIKPLLTELADDLARLARVDTVGSMSTSGITSPAAGGGRGSRPDRGLDQPVDRGPGCWI
jgi:transposase